MEYNEIRALLDRYWEGETSLEEEALLRSFFSQEHHDLPADLLEAQPLFGYFVAAAQREVPALPAVVVPMTRPWQHWMKYAAVALIAIGIGYGAKQFQVKQQHTALAFAEKDTYDDPKEAYAVTKKALELIAKNLNKGTSQVQKISYFNEATQVIKAD